MSPRAYSSASHVVPPVAQETDPNDPFADLEASEPAPPRTRKLYCHTCGCLAEVKFMVEDSGFGFIDRDGRAAESLQLHRYPISSCCKADVYGDKALTRRFEGEEFEILSTPAEDGYRLDRLPFAGLHPNTFSVELFDPQGRLSLLGHSLTSYESAESYALRELKSLRSYEHTLSRIVDAIWGDQ